MDERPIDMLSSYIELEVDIPTLQDKRNVILGDSGFQYEPSCFFRSIKMEDSGRGVVCQTNYVNVLNENLKYISCSENDKLSESIYNGSAHNNPNASGITAHQLVSVFSNEYPDTPYPVIRCPLSSLIKGELGEAMYQQRGDLNLRTNLEPSYQLFQRAVEAFVYTGDVETTGIPYSLADASGITSIFTTTGSAADLLAQNYAIVSASDPTLTRLRKVTNISAPVSGVTTITLDQTVALATGRTITNVSDSHEIICNDETASTAILTLKTAYSPSKDIRALTTEKTRVKVNYMVYNASSSEVVMESVLRTVNAVDVNGDDDIVEITLDQQLVLPAGGEKLIFISVEPLFTNLVRDYQIQNAHLVLYRRNQKVKEGKQMVVSQFSSNAVACVASLDRFVHSVPALSNNCFNAYVLTPSATNMISQRQNFTQYLLSIDELQLTQVYLPLSGSALHKENVLRTFSNSPTEKPMNLKTNRDRYIAKSGEITQDLVVGKIYSSMLGGEMNIQPVGNSRTLKIDMEATSTLATNVLIFTEQYMML
jgi:transcriptional regulator of met regulon